MEQAIQLTGEGELKRSWGWFLALGIVLIVLGTIAIGSTLVMTIASVFFFGWLLIIGGVMEVIHAFWHKRWAGFFLDLLTGVLYVVVGWMMVTNPKAVGSLADFGHRHVLAFRGGISDRDGARCTLSALGLAVVERCYLSFIRRYDLAAVALFGSMGNRSVRGHRNAAQRLVACHAWLDRSQSPRGGVDDSGPFEPAVSVTVN